MRTLRNLILAGFMLAMPALAQETVVSGPDAEPGGGADINTVVVELYTSQGCSSCPGADAFFQELAARDDVLALALHVDYWDYIGWKDSFGSPEYTARQRSYARAGGRRMIYTPQMIVNGLDDVVGTHRVDVVDVIDRHKTMQPYVKLNIARDGSRLHIRAEAYEPLEDRLTVQLIRYLPHARVDIERGENAGRSISYVNIVTSLEVLQQWDTQKPLDLEAEVRGSDPVVVVLQHEGYGPVAAAMRLQ